MSGSPYPKAGLPAWTEAAGTGIVRARAGGLCEAGVPDVCTVRAGDYVGQFSHRRARKQGGSWAPSNGVRCCPHCHHHVETHWEWAVTAGLRVPSYADPAVTPVYLRLQPWWHGWWLLVDVAADDDMEGAYISDGALDAARALGMPEDPYRLEAS